MAPMPEAVLHPAVAATNQRIYMFGGEDAMQNPLRIIQVKLSVGLHWSFIHLPVQSPPLILILYLYPPCSMV